MKLKKNYILWGLIANIFQYGIPLAYVVWQYDIFKFEDATKSLTGWGFVVVAIIFSIFKNKITDFIGNYNTKLGEVAKKAKWGFLFLGIGLLLALASLWIDGMMFFMLTLGFSNMFSLMFYAPYYLKKQEYNELKELIIKHRREEKIKGVTI